MPEKTVRKPLQGRRGDSTPGKFGEPHPSSSEKLDRKPQVRDQCETPTPGQCSSCGLCHTWYFSLDIFVATLSVVRELQLSSEAVSELQILRPRVDSEPKKPQRTMDQKGRRG